jgi:hypothetical protein
MKTLATIAAVAGALAAAVAAAYLATRKRVPATYTV